MSRHTGGRASGATSTRSIPNSSASHLASSIGLTPICPPSGATNLTSRDRILSLTLGSCAIDRPPVSMVRHVTRKKTAARLPSPQIGPPSSGPVLVTSAHRKWPGGKQRLRLTLGCTGRRISGSYDRVNVRLLVIRHFLLELSDRLGSQPAEKGCPLQARRQRRRGLWPSPLPLDLAPVTQAIRTGQSTGPFLLTIRRADGTEAITRTYCSPFFDHEGAVIGAIVTSEDLDAAISSEAPGRTKTSPHSAGAPIGANALPPIASGLSRDRGIPAGHLEELPLR
jgi:hypothetical protein